MSTKIYNGYLLPQMPFPKLHLLMRRVQKELKVEAQRIHEENLGRIVEKLLSASALGNCVSADETGYSQDAPGSTPENPIKMVNPLSAAWFYLAEEERKGRRENTRHPATDLETSWTIIPANGKTYCILFTEHDRLRRIFKRATGATPYPYWNNTDRPSNLTQKAWEARGDEWKRALNAPTTAECGWTMDMWGLGGANTIDTKMRKRYVAKLNRLLPVSTRALRIATENLTTEKMRELLAPVEAAAKKAGKKTEFHDMTEAYWAADKWVRHTQEGIDAVHTRQAQYMEKLKPITVESLTQEIPVKLHVPVIKEEPKDTPKVPKTLVLKSKKGDVLFSPNPKKVWAEADIKIMEKLTRKGYFTRFGGWVENLRKSKLSNKKRK